MRPNQNEIQFLTARVIQQPEAFYFQFESFVSSTCAKKMPGWCWLKIYIFCLSVYSDRYSDKHSVRCPCVGPLLSLSSFLLWFVEWTGQCGNIFCVLGYLCWEIIFVNSNLLRQPLQWKILNNINVSVKEIGNITCTWLLLCCRMFEKHASEKPELVKTVASVTCDVSTLLV